MCLRCSWARSACRAQELRDWIVVGRMLRLLRWMRSLWCLRGAVVVSGLVKSEECEMYHFRAS